MYACCGCVLMRVERPHKWSCCLYAQKRLEWFTTFRNTNKMFGYSRAPQVLSPHTQIMEGLMILRARVLVVACWRPMRSNVFMARQVASVPGLHSLLITPSSSLSPLHSLLFTLFSSLPPLHSLLFTLSSSLPPLHSLLFTPSSSLSLLHSLLFTPFPSLFFFYSLFPNFFSTFLLTFLEHHRAELNTIEQS